MAANNYLRGIKSFANALAAFFSIVILIENWFQREHYLFTLNHYLDMCVIIFLNVVNFIELNKYGNPNSYFINCNITIIIHLYFISKYNFHLIYIHWYNKCKKYLKPKPKYIYDKVYTHKKLLDCQIKYIIHDYSS